MRKLTALILVFVWVLSICVFPIHAEEEVSYAQYERPYKILSELEIIADDFGALESLGEEAARAQAVTSVIRLLGLHSEDEVTNPAFADVDFFASYAADIQTAKDLNLISGVSPTSFAPHDAILCQDAIKILVTALNYEAKALSYGGYPAGYLTVASELGLLSGIKMSADSELTKLDLLLMLYNAANAEYADPKYFTDETIEYVSASKRSILTKRGIYKGIGIVERAGGTEIGSDVVYSSKNNEVKIGGTMYTPLSAEVDPLLGYEVEFYYNEEMEILALAKTPQNEEFMLGGKDIVSVVGETLSYLKEDDTAKKVRKLDLSPNLNVVYNGRIDPYFTDDDFLSVYGTVKLLDNDGDGTYDLAFVTSYTNYIVKSKNSQELVIYGEGQSLSLEASGLKRVDIYRNGVPIDFASIMPNSLISAEVSRDGTKVVAYVCDTVVVGTVTEAGSESVMIGGQEYRWAPFLKDPLAVGDEGRFYLDVLGRISYHQAMNTALQYGYLVGAKKALLLGAGTELKVLTTANGMQVLKAAKKVSVNDAAAIGADKLLEVLPKDRDGAVMPGLIAFTRNSEGAINNLYTTACTDEDILKAEYLCTKTENAPDPDTGRITYTYSQLGFRGYNMIFATDGVIENIGILPNATVFNVPKPEDAGDAEDEDYAVTDASAFLSERSYSIDAYNGEDIGIAGLVVNYVDVGTNAEVASHGAIAMVDKVTTTTVNGEERDKFYLLGNGKELEYASYKPNMVADGELKRGMIIQYMLNAQNQISGWRLVLNPYVDNDPASLNTSAYAAFGGIYGRVYAKDSMYLRVSVTKTGGSYDFVNTSTMRLTNAGKGAFHVFDKELDQAYVASGISAATDYVSAGEEACTVYVRVEGNDARQTFIFYE